MVDTGFEVTGHWNAQRQVFSDRPLSCTSHIDVIYLIHYSIITHSNLMFRCVHGHMCDSFHQLVILHVGSSRCQGWETQMIIFTLCVAHDHTDNWQCCCYNCRTVLIFHFGSSYSIVLFIANPDENIGEKSLIFQPTDITDITDIDIRMHISNLDCTTVLHCAIVLVWVFAPRIRGKLRWASSIDIELIIVLWWLNRTFRFSGFVSNGWWAFACTRKQHASGANLLVASPNLARFVFHFLAISLCVSMVWSQLFGGNCWLSLVSTSCRH